MAKKQFAVIGLGRFGVSVARKLMEARHDVLGIDIRDEKVEDVEQYFTHAAVADATEEKALTALGVRNFECVIVAIGNDIQSSILTTMLLKNLGVQKIIAKAVSKRHGQVLEKIGVDWIIYPEKDMGERVAKQLLSPNVLNYIELSKEHNIEEIKLPVKMVGKNLRELNLRAKYNINVIALVRDGDVIVSLSPEHSLQQDDFLIVIGNRKDLVKFSDL
ncbi:potassium uptake system protein [Lysinibacillus contaminans]|uniref:Potassium uptake system protein n=1 Tax=Lysinibacillus contaminans TaxID=1293441 RepID=A0ABR5JWF3_9BACI|nr:TrkA family potassium uptake protein [Lysinibacillus contaminans]KOS66326.1 potassium uptake system protein [Lysinibacillus contaminans]